MPHDEFHEVSEALRDYLDGIFHGDVEKLTRILHPCLTFYSATDGALEATDRSAYLEKVKVRPSPESRGDPREDSVESITFAGPVTAHVRLRCSYLPRRFVDLLTLVKLDGSWRIVAKVYHYELDPSWETSQRTPATPLRS